jgi:hypothetical protein
MPDAMAWIAPVYLRVLIDRVEAPTDAVLLAEAVEYAERALRRKVPAPTLGGDLLIAVRRADVQGALDSIPPGICLVNPNAVANLAEALKRDDAAPEPSLPEGEYARVEIMGHDHETGWVTDGTRAGVPVLVIRGWDGRVLREVPGQALYQFIPLPTPLKRPEPQRALPGAGWTGYEVGDRMGDDLGSF